MNIRLVELAAILGGFFGFFGSIMAFIIAYDEYKRHFRERSKPIWMALEMAILAFFVLVALSTLAGYILSKTVASQISP